MSNSNLEPKHYYVPWEGYSEHSTPEHRTELDRLCLQGPHTLKRAMQVAAEIRAAGCLASVVDCSETLSNRKLFSAIEKLDLSCRFDVLNPCTLSKIAGKHWGGGDSCPECAVKIMIGGGK